LTTYESNGLEVFWHYYSDCCCELTETYNFGAETQLVTGDMSTFVFHRLTLLSAHFDFHWQYSSQEMPTKKIFWLHCHKCCHALTLISAKTHPDGKVVSTLIIFCLPSGHHCSLDSNGMVLTCHVR